jgi:hypothetical protein
MSDRIRWAPAASSAPIPARRARRGDVTVHGVLIQRLPRAPRVLFKDNDLAQDRRWHERAAEAGTPRAMNNLGLLLKDSDSAPGTRMVAAGRGGRPRRCHVQLGDAAHGQ